MQEFLTGLVFGVFVTAMTLGTYMDYTSRKTMLEKCTAINGVVVSVNEKRICTDKIVEKKIVE